jgi:hypothetical protein
MRLLFRLLLLLRLLYNSELLLTVLHDGLVLPVHSFDSSPITGLDLVLTLALPQQLILIPVTREMQCNEVPVLAQLVALQLNRSFVRRIDKLGVIPLDPLLEIRLGGRTVLSLRVCFVRLLQHKVRVPVLPRLLGLEQLWGPEGSEPSFRSHEPVLWVREDDRGDVGFEDVAEDFVEAFVAAR